MAQTLKGLFTAAYAKKAPDLLPDLNKATYSLWNNVPPPENYQMVVHPDAYKKLMEDTMGTCDTIKACEESVIKAELTSLKYRVNELRNIIAQKQEQLRIELAKLAAVKKLAKGGK